MEASPRRSLPPPGRTARSLERARLRELDELTVTVERTNTIMSQQTGTCWLGDCRPAGPGRSACTILTPGQSRKGRVGCPAEFGTKLRSPDHEDRDRPCRRSFVA